MAWFNQVRTRLLRKRRFRRRRLSENRIRTLPPLRQPRPPAVKTIRPNSRAIPEPGRSRIQINGKLNVCSGRVDFWHVRLAVISEQAVVDLDRSGFARCLVGERDGFEILDPWIVAVTRANPVAPGAAVENVSGGLAFPHINATGD